MTLMLAENPMQRAASGKDGERNAVKRFGSTEEENNEKKKIKNK
jgi:hypothetical protein